MNSQTHDNSVSLPNVTWSDKVWQFLRFLVITGIIFMVSFFAINFHAYKSILANALNPEARVEKESILKGGEVDDSKLLPVLNAENAETQKTYAWLDFPIVPPDNRVVIPKLGVSAPLVTTSNETAGFLAGKQWSELEEAIQDGLRNGVVHYPTTANPGEMGNVFITGHSSYYPWERSQFKEVFASLGDLEIGDEYYVYYNQKKYTYVVRNKFEVNPDNIDVLMQPKDKRMSTLMTCTPVGTALRRLIIQAEEVL